MKLEDTRLDHRLYLLAQYTLILFLFVPCRSEEAVIKRKLDEKLEVTSIYHLSTEIFIQLAQRVCSLTHIFPLSLPFSLAPSFHEADICNHDNSQMSRCSIKIQKVWSH